MILFNSFKKHNELYKKEILDTKDVITKEGKELDNFIDKNNKDILELEKDD